MKTFKTITMVMAMVIGLLVTGVNAEAATTGHLYRDNDRRYYEENAETFRGVVFDYYGNRMELTYSVAEFKDAKVGDKSTITSEKTATVMQYIYDMYKMVDDELTRNGDVDYVVYVNEYYDGRLTKVDWQTAKTIRDEAIEILKAYEAELMKQRLNVTDYLTIS